jgi:hypothetical protein
MWHLLVDVLAWTLIVTYVIGKLGEVVLPGEDDP